MRGRLINTFLVEIACLDTAETEEASAYDAEFRTPKVSYTNGVRSVGRVEKQAIRIPCQIEVTDFSKMKQTPGGDDPQTRMMLVMHFRDLENAGLVDATTKDAMIRKGDRILGIYNRKSGALEQKCENLFVVNVEPGGLGLGGRRNLLLVTVTNRPKSM